jgi:hypothetical protein
MKATTNLLIVAISAVGLLATMEAASAAAHHAMAKSGAEPGTIAALFSAPAPSSPHKHKK